MNYAQRGMNEFRRYQSMSEQQKRQALQRKYERYHLEAIAELENNRLFEEWSQRTHSRIVVK